MIYNFKVSETLETLFETIKNYYTPNLKKGSDTIIKLEVGAYILEYQFDNIIYCANKKILESNPETNLYMKEGRFFFAPENIEIKDSDIVIDILQKIIENLKQNSAEWSKEKILANEFTYKIY